MSQPKNKLDYFLARDQAHPLNTFYEGEENFDGLLTENRRFTDILVLIVFLILNGGLIYYSYLVISQSDWRRLYDGVDFRTDFCGHNQLINQTHLYFYDPENVGTIGICMQNCPPADGVDVCFYSQTNNQSLDDYCYKTYSTSAVGYYCMPLDMKSAKRKIIEEDTRSTLSTMRQIAGDIWRLKDLICISFGIMLLVGILFSVSFLVKKPIVVSILIGIYFAIGFAFIGWMIYLVPQDEDRILKKYCKNGSSKDGCQEEYLFFLMILKYVMIGIGGFLFLGVLVYGRRAKRIGQYICFFNENIKMGQAFLFLIGNFVCEIIFLLFGLFLFVSAMSSGVVQTVDAPKAFPNPYYRKTVIDDINIYGLIFVGVMFYWWILGFSNFNRFVLTSAISTYYFSKAKQILNKPVSRGVKFGLMNNLGSILICSFILPIVWPIRAFCFRVKQIFVKTIDKTTKRFRYCLAFWTPCLILHEASLKFFRTRNLIHVLHDFFILIVTIFGDDFYRAGQRLFFLRNRNLSRIESFRKYLGFITFVGNIFISSSGSCFIYTYITLMEETFLEEKIGNLEYFFGVPFIIFLLSIFLANIFGNVYDHLTETILICFIADEEMFTGRHRFAEEPMRKFMDIFGQESDDVRNMANTKVNPFKADKDNEVVKYEPMVPLNNVNGKMNRTADNNFMNFLKINDLEPESGEKLRKIEKIYDPINNTFKVHAQLIQKNNEEDEEGEEEGQNKTVKSLKTLNTNNDDEKKGETPIISGTQSQSKIPMNISQPVINNSNPAPPVSQTRLATPKTEKVTINSRPNSQNINTAANMINTSLRPETQSLFVQNPQRPVSNRLNQASNNEFRPLSNSNQNASKLNQSRNELKVEDVSRPGTNNQLRVENFSRPGTNNNKNERPTSKNEQLNNSMNQNRSFVEIKKLEVEDLENSQASFENDEEEEKKNQSINLSKDYGKGTKIIEKSNKFFDNFNTNLNLDQNRNKNANLAAKNNIKPDNPFHF